MKRKTKINIHLTKGDTIDIYTDYQEERRYQGQAILLEKVRDGDSYYLRYEKLKPKDAKEYDNGAKKRIIKYNRLINFLKGSKSRKPSIYCRRLYRDLIKLRKDELGEFGEMKKVLAKYRKKHKDSIKMIGSVLNEYSDYYIIKFVQQDRNTWRPSIFSYERWKVRFISDSSGWEQNWITTRNIRVLKCLNPSESMRRSQLVEFTTYDSMSSRKYDRIVHKKKYREKQEKQNESIFINDSEMDELILNRLNNKDE